jgi:hypothetical protein
MELMRLSGASKGHRRITQPQLLLWIALLVTCLLLSIWIVSAKCVIEIASGNRYVLTLFRGSVVVAWSPRVEHAALRHSRVDGIVVDRSFDFGFRLPSIEDLGAGMHVYTCPMWLLFLPAATGTCCVWLHRRSARRRIVQPACPVCGYCLRGNESGRCPECGHILSAGELRALREELSGSHKDIRKGLAGRRGAGGRTR